MTEYNLKKVLDIFEDMFDESLTNKKLTTRGAIFDHFRRVKIKLMKQLWDGKIVLER